MIEMISRIRKIYNLLSDDISKDVYMSRLNYVMSYNYNYMHYIINKYLPEISECNKNDIEKLLSILPENEKFVIYCVGEGVYSNSYLFCNDKRLLCYCDKSPLKQKHIIKGKKVISPEELFTLKDVNVVVSSSEFYDEVYYYLIDNGIPSNKIYKMYSEGLIEDKNQYFPSDIIKLGENEVFVDAGCYDFANIKSFIEHCKSVRKIYAFEPEKKNYDLCVQKSQKYREDIEVFNLGVWSHKETLKFQDGNGARTLLSDNGGTSVDVAAIDDCVYKSISVTYIKMDIEGAELEALKGARETILRDKPRLAICIYHKPEDLWEIPEYILSLHSDYKLYVRHHSNRLAETVLYAIP